MHQCSSISLFSDARSNLLLEVRVCRTRLLSLMSHRSQVAQEVELLTSLLAEVERELRQSSRSSLIGSSAHLLPRTMSLKKTQQNANYDKRHVN